MLFKLFRPKRRAAAPPTELVSLVDLPPDGDPQVALALQKANMALANGGARAVAVLERTCQERPGDALAQALLGFFLEHTGAMDRAARAYDSARRLEASRPVQASAGHHFFVRGVHHLNAKDPDRADGCLRLAERLLPQYAAPLEMRGLAGYLSGDTAAARSCFDRALEVAAPAERGALEVNRLIDTLPQVGMTSAELAESRAWFEAELERLLRDPPAIPDPLAAIHRTAFFLCYQGRNDRSVNARLAELFLRACPGLGHVCASAGPGARPRGRKLTVGLVSGHLGRHSVGVWYRDLARHLIERDRFDTVLFAYGEDVEPRLEAAARSRAAYVPLGATLGDARERIQARRPDVLLYTDVGLHPFLYFLAFGRLAPVQALLIGHPCTSGIPAIDYFLSNVFQDSEQAQAHYSERLVRLPSIAVHVARTPRPAAPLGREALGWERRTRYYVCPMMLQKLHPDFDGALAAILRRDPRGRVVLFGDRERPLWQHQLEKRFSQAAPDVADRVQFRPFAPKDEFLSVLLAADCVLDPFHFSGGVTTYAALSLGVPVVTLPGELLRSRMTAGMYLQAGITDCIARSPEHFVDLALALAGDPATRTRVGAALTAAHPALFETDRAVDDLADWIDEAAATRG